MLIVSNSELALLVKKYNPEKEVSCHAIIIHHHVMNQFCFIYFFRVPVSTENLRFMEDVLFALRTNSTHPAKLSSPPQMHIMPHANSAHDYLHRNELASGCARGLYTAGQKQTP